MLYIPSKSPILKLWKYLGDYHLGRWLVSQAVCFKAPYFGTIKPIFTEIKPGLVELTFKKRRAIQNHIHSVHAIAMCNAAELVAGVCLDVSLSTKLRWIPVGMTVNYEKIAKTDLRAICEISDFSWDHAQEVILPVKIYNTENTVVLTAEITMRLSEKNALRYNIT